ncbi:transglycosylase [Maribellus comscasis]|uniref:Transglycosylase n=1 Tax=Maribellus comscasis TaxID=2681766 RepID=A0A6I6JQ90_9BACT|nr:transglycosylase [Maribellus comscasis]QGY42297.1 transglycosylase [Maribellus comscasis]
MKVFGTILTVLGLIGTILFGIQAANNSETFSLLGIDVAVSEANWTPVIVSGVVTVIGILILLINKGK